jgi:hypothetical protein
MSKKLINLLQKLGVEDAENVANGMLSDDDNLEVLDTVLKASHSYSKPFLEAEFNGKLNEERKTWKGKYFKDAAQKANKTLGNKLTSSEIDAIMSDPANEGKTFDAVIDAIREKVSQKTGTNESELQSMLDSANGKIGEYEQKLIDQERKHKEDFDNYVKTGKLTTALKTKLVTILKAHTSLNAEKAAELLLDPVMKKALVKLNDKDGLELFDPANPDSRLRKSDTAFMELDDVVKGLADEYDLPKIKSPGAESVTPFGQQRQDAPNKLNNNPAFESATKLAAAFDAQ